MSLKVSVKRKHVSKVNMSVPKRNFERNFTNVLGSCMFLARPQAERWLYIHSFIMKKYIKLFRMSGG